MIPRENMASTASICVMLAVSALWVCTGKAQRIEYRDAYEYQRNDIKRGPVPGRIIVCVLQTPQQGNFFSMQDGRLVVKGRNEASSRLNQHSVERAYRAFQVHGNAIYVLEFAEYGTEKEIMRYLESLPGVQYAEQDYYIELLAALIPVS
jgi:hypothetical protein